MKRRRTIAVLCIMAMVISAMLAFAGCSGSDKGESSAVSSAAPSAESVESAGPSETEPASAGSDTAAAEPTASAGPDTGITLTQAIAQEGTHIWYEVRGENRNTKGGVKVSGDMKITRVIVFADSRLTVYETDSNRAELGNLALADVSGKSTEEIVTLAAAAEEKTVDSYIAELTKLKAELADLDKKAAENPDAPVTEISKGASSESALSAEAPVVTWNSSGISLDISTKECDALLEAYKAFKGTERRAGLFKMGMSTDDDDQYIMVENIIYRYPVTLVGYQEGVYIDRSIRHFNVKPFTFASGEFNGKNYAGYLDQLENNKYYITECEPGTEFIMDDPDFEKYTDFNGYCNFSQLESAVSSEYYDATGEESATGLFGAQACD